MHTQRRKIKRYEQLYARTNSTNLFSRRLHQAWGGCAAPYRVNNTTILLYAAQLATMQLIPTDVWSEIPLDADQLLIDVFVHARFVFLFIPWLTCNSEDRNSPSNVL
jgi:hypothetical protein